MFCVQLLMELDTYIFLSAFPATKHKQAITKPKQLAKGTIQIKCHALIIQPPPDGFILMQGIQMDSLL